MCEFRKENSNEGPVTGSKVAIEKNGKFYSPITGIEYIADAPVEGVINQRPESRYADLGYNNVLSPWCTAYDGNYHGLTAAFETVKAAKFLLKCMNMDKRARNKRFKLSIIKIELSKEVYNGYYMQEPVYLGTFINSIAKFEVRFKKSGKI
jgi:hypothetical protein